MAANVDQCLRLDRLLSMLGLCSRSQARDWIKSGRVAVNGKTAAAPEMRLRCGDALALDGQPIDARTRRTIMLNKPCGVLTAARDKKQKTVLDLLPPVFAALQCMPVGRLDKDTEGLLLLTTDGELAHQLLSPKRHVWKCYQAVVDGALGEADAAAFAAGLDLSDFTALPAKLQILSSAPEESTALVLVREGKFHQVRRMFAARGRTVTALKRLQFGPLALDERLAPGAWRELSANELAALRQAVSGEENHDR